MQPSRRLAALLAFAALGTGLLTAAAEAAAPTSTVPTAPIGVTTPTPAPTSTPAGQPGPGNPSTGPTTPPSCPVDFIWEAGVCVPVNPSPSSGTS
ncbi:hypothetical protein [Kitasatospora viridis]|uniref:Uncharacterized protein n=1 Tax=Kitasatospora viridis TaxID=281105 RepID=A0A561UPY3_9ACTN|nr:hypothetical protein [Kitasatospora viridis]TWG01438.1 hypothetical protein FHX73_115331 [Kitasatospora viridis]